MGLTDITEGKKMDCSKIGCSAPICPVVTEKDVWYVGEEICNSPRHCKIPQVRMQRKIAAKKLSGYFTWEMLSRGCIVGRGMKGLDPDKDQSEQLAKWFRDHPPKKEKTEAEKTVLRDRFKKSMGMVSA